MSAVVSFLLEKKTERQYKNLGQIKKVQARS